MVFFPVLNKGGVWKKNKEKKRFSRTAIFSNKGALRRLIVHTSIQFQKETEIWQHNFEGKFFRRFQAGSFIEV